jgi:putative ABC transport system permease protein
LARTVVLRRAGAGRALIGLLAGLYPALLLARLSPFMALRGAGRSGGGSAALRQGLVVLQFAASIGLIVLTIFIQRQAEHARDANLTEIAGDPLVVISNVRRLPDDRVRALLVQRYNEAPGIRAATAAALVQGDSKLSTSVRDDIVPGMQISFSWISTDAYFARVHGLRLVEGRDYDPGRDVAPPDEDQTTPRKVVVNESAARLFGFANPAEIAGRVVGSRATIDGQLEVIGVVADFPMQSAKETTGPTVITNWFGDYRYITVRVTGASLREGLASIDRIWDEVVPGMPIERQFADERMERIWRATQREADVLSVFAGVAVLIGCLGLLGLSAYMAERRTKEIGIRKAMGASTADVVRLLVLQLTRPVIAANLLAWPVALWFVQRWLSGFADRMAIDAWPFLVASAGTLLLAWAVVVGHALSVGRARPVLALRYE